MKNAAYFIKIFAVFVVLYMVFPQTAYAYLELGSGSYVIQLIIGALFGGLFAVKLYWGKIKLFFKRLFSGKTKHDTGKN